MRDTFYPQKFRNINTNEITERYIWTSDLEKENYPEDLQPYFEKVNEAPMVGKMTKDQIRTERKARSTNHFKKEVLPTLGSDEQRHFKKKFS